MSLTPLVVIWRVVKRLSSPAGIWRGVASIGRANRGISPKDPADGQQRCQRREEHRQKERKGKYNEYPDDNRQADQRADNGDGFLVRWSNQCGQYRGKQRRECAAHRCNDDLRNRMPRDQTQGVREPQCVTKKVGHPQQEHAEKNRGVNAADCQRNDE